uniref:Putative cpij008974 cuticle protein n=1 Tax=Aedes albopictus TaxID=7160 RepID=A0A023EIQ2_AEDAL
MLKLSILIVALFGVALASRHHGYVTHVKHVPFKASEATESVQESEQAVADGAQESGQSEGQEAGLEAAEGAQEENASGLDEEADKTESDQIDNQLQSQGAYGGQQEDDEFGSSHFTYPKYKFEYGVRDFHTGDHKSQWEIRDGDFVKGEYTLADADGTQRIVKYRADDKNGFRADVRQLGKGFAQQGAQEESLDGQNEIGEKFGYSYSKLRRYH